MISRHMPCHLLIPCTCLAGPRVGTTRGYLPIFSVSPKYAHCASRRLRTEDPSLSRLVQSRPDPFACVVPGRASCVNWPFGGVQLTQLDVLHARAHQIADALRQKKSQFSSGHIRISSVLSVSDRGRGKSMTLCKQSVNASHSNPCTPPPRTAHSFFIAPKRAEFDESMNG